MVLRAQDSIVAGYMQLPGCLNVLQDQQKQLVQPWGALHPGPHPDSHAAACHPCKLNRSCVIAWPAAVHPSLTQQRDHTGLPCPAV